MTFTQPVSQYNNAGRIIAPVFGDVSMYEGEPPYWLEEADAGHRTDPATLRSQPSRLLHARHRFIEFTGRETEMQRLRRWRDAAVPSRVMLLHAPGGHGKTRLALEFTRDSARAGWRTWHARHAHDPAERGAPVFAVGSTGGRHLVVADYADRWSHRSLHALCATAASDPGDGVRLLLVSRTLRGWWALRGELDELDVDYADLGLEPINASGGRAGLFEAAKAQFASLFEMPLEQTAPVPRTIDAEQYASILSVHMAALAAVPAEGETDRPPEEVDEVAAFLLAREIRNWERLRLAERDFRSGYRALTQAVFTAVLTGPHPNYRDAQAALHRAGIGDNLDQLLDDHRAIYPPADDRHSLEPLYPDRLAEDFLGLLTPGHGVSFYTNPWAAVAPVDLVRREPGAEPFPHTAQTLIFLTAAATRWPHLNRTLARVLESDPALGVLGGGASLHAVATAPGLETEVLEQVAEHLPSKLGLDLVPGAEAIISAIADRRLAESTQSATGRAYLLAEMAQRRLQIADAKGANKAGTAAVSYLRPLADEDPQRHGPPLCAALGVLAQSHAMQLHFEEALEAIDESERLCRRFQAPDGPLVPADLARVLSVRSALLHAAGRTGEARGLADEGESLVIDLPEGETEHLGTVANLAMTRALALRAQGNLDEAIEIVRDLCDRIERDRDEDDDESLVVLSRLLFNLGAIAGEADRFEEAHGPLTKVVEICEMLEPRNPGLFTSLRRVAELNLEQVSAALSEPGEHGTMGGKHTMTLKLHGELFQRSFDADANTGAADSTDPVEAFDLVEEAKAVWSEGRQDDALDLIERAVGIAERLHRIDPSVDVEGLLAFALLNCAVLRHDAGDWRAAAPAARRSVTLLRKLHRLDREFLEEFCLALELLAECLARIGHTVEARNIRGELNSVRPQDMEWPF
ncbi:hypothetical protein L0U85_09305 [Glycomyces sp. L485]|uniref:hypothetical protein n=1 Tax=Glycomyces sp. L485 TaxID=2909235 RepID=UPI001F4B6C64|nr:hypothetical protein [Glycomyces sp. L485]MCH7231046.1 hypothetical protein [Glycomyces sp. L485]